MPYDSSIKQGLSVELETSLQNGTKLFLLQSRVVSNLIFTAKPPSVTTASTNVLTNAWVGAAMQANSRLTIDATVQGVRADGAAYGCYRLNASFFRTATGAGTQIGATTVIYTRESNAALNATLTVVNSFPTVQVIDGAQGTIVWDVWIQGFS